MAEAMLEERNESPPTVGALTVAVARRVMTFRMNVLINLKSSIACEAINFLAARIDLRDSVWNTLSCSERELSSIRRQLCNLSYLKCLVVFWFLHLAIIYLLARKAVQKKRNGHLFKTKLTTWPQNSARTKINWESGLKDLLDNDVWIIQLIFKKIGSVNI